MTTSDQPEPESAPTPSPAVTPTPTPTEQTAALPPAAPQQYAEQPYPQQYAPAPYVFAPPPPKPPRERWVNPSKRVAISLISIVAALVLLFVGAIIGHAIDRNHGVGNAEFQRPKVGPFQRNGGPNYRQLPNLPRRNGPTSLPSVSAHPTATATS
jgi:hypothetical protein